VEIGVDDGQFARILNFEIPQLKRAFKGKLFLEKKENKEKTFFSILS